MPLVILVGVTLNSIPLQTVVLIGVIADFESTKTTAVKDVPKQLLTDLGVMI
jgi:hypothetical protein